MKRKINFIGLMVTLGIVYGDIGTSPLYVMKTIVGVNHHVTADYIIGALSCIIWTITLQTTVKYVLIALRADNNGEGGILALYALIRKMKRKWLYIVAVIGASTLVADGVITPAITVMSAIEGLERVSSDIPVVPISLLIVTVLFFVQQFGTRAIGRSFGPLMLLWFLMLGTLGMFHLWEDLSVLKAFNPYYAFRLLIDSPQWFLILGAVFLCTTGAEALYSDLGHCGKRNIHITWAFVKSMLILNYLGQGAWIISHMEELHRGVNPFYAIIPQWMLLPGVAMATIAAVIASQALISGSFTIFNEAMNLNFWPRQLIRYTSDVKGQLYIPFVNKFLYVFCVLTILFFQNSGNMEAAYGLSITITMLMTTLLLGCFLRLRSVKMWVIILFLALFLPIELCFFTANMFKFMHGGWVTILIAGSICFVMYIFYNARIIRRRFFKFLKFKDYYGILSDIKADKVIPAYATNVIYMSRAEHDDEIEQKIIYSIMNKQPKRADHYWILYVDYVDNPSTLEYTFNPLIPDTLFRVNLRIGFRIQPYINLYFRQIVEDLVRNKECDIMSGYPSLRKHGITGDFRFVVIHRIFHEASFTMRDNFIMQMYEIIRHIGISDLKAYGLDTSNVTVEKVPLDTTYKEPKRRICRVSGGEASGSWFM